jgi:hypothetical protein
MEQQVTPLEARAALDAIDRGRQRVIDEIDLPRWYWWGLAIGWIVLGFISDLNKPWVSVTATLAFGVAHSAVAPRVLSGRHRSGRLSVSAQVAGRETPRLVLGMLIALIPVTVGVALALQADGANHPATIASCFVAVIIVLGGPRLLAEVRKRRGRATA